MTAKGTALQPEWTYAVPWTRVVQYPWVAISQAKSRLDR